MKNVGGTALHVRVRAEADEVVLIGDLDRERVESGKYLPFGVPELFLGGVGDTWLHVTSKDATGVDQPLARVRIPGMLG